MSETLAHGEEFMSADLCIPPLEKAHKEFHWLISERSSKAVPSVWMNHQWYSFGEAGPISPAEMYRRGWRWSSVAKPPRKTRRWLKR